MQYFSIATKVNETPENDVCRLSPNNIAVFQQKQFQPGGEKKKEDKSPVIHIKNVTNFSIYVLK